LIHPHYTLNSATREKNIASLGIDTAMRQIALIYPFTVPWMGDLFLGVNQYAKEHGDWSILTSPPTLTGTGEIAMTLYNLKGWPGDGVITAISDSTQVAAAKKLNLPLVNISGALRNLHFPTVALDQYEVGRMAADHLHKCGFRRLAYYGIKELYYSQQRQLGFKETANKAGILVNVFEEHRPANARSVWQQRTADLVPWLQSLKPPFGLLAIHDYRARMVIDECQHLGLQVPNDVAVLGVDNDPTVCECCRPTLSSICRDGFQQGYEAARLLDRLMEGKLLKQKLVSIPPRGIIERRSTDTITVDEAHVNTLIQYMYEHLGESFGIKRLVRLVPISRRGLEKQFRRTLHCTPYEYLSSLRVEKAKQLLLKEKPGKLKNIAALCGFSNPIQFRIVFKRITGLTPSQYLSRSPAKKTPREVH
jgi:LacI family transcriptional regulator